MTDYRLEHNATIQRQNHRKLYLTLVVPNSFEVEEVVKHMQVAAEKFTSQRKPRSHPFEGGVYAPESEGWLDEQIATLSPGETVISKEAIVVWSEEFEQAASHPVTGEYPHIDSVLESFRQKLADGGLTRNKSQEIAEGDWQLPTDDHVGEDD